MYIRYLETGGGWSYPCMCLHVTYEMIYIVAETPDLWYLETQGQGQY